MSDLQLAKLYSILKPTAIAIVVGILTLEAGIYKGRKAEAAQRELTSQAEQAAQAELISESQQADNDTGPFTLLGSPEEDRILGDLSLHSSRETRILILKIKYLRELLHKKIREHDALILGLKDDQTATNMEGTRS